MTWPKHKIRPSGTSHYMLLSIAAMSLRNTLAVCSSRLIYWPPQQSLSRVPQALTRMASLRCERMSSPSHMESERADLSTVVVHQCRCVYHWRQTRHVARSTRFSLALRCLRPCAVAPSATSARLAERPHPGMRCACEAGARCVTHLCIRQRYTERDSGGRRSCGEAIAEAIAGGE